jgi:phosphatidylglycerol:prolipoprotein diacylglycerol transferase
LYETLMATVIFSVLWWLRKRMRVAGMVFALYLVFNGLERLLIEQIRVNADLGWWSGVTQAELIAVCTALGGGAFFAYLARQRRPA